MVLVLNSRCLLKNAVNISLRTSAILIPPNDSNRNPKINYLWFIFTDEQYRKSGTALLCCMSLIMNSSLQMYNEQYRKSGTAQLRVPIFCILVQFIFTGYNAKKVRTLVPVPDIMLYVFTSDLIFTDEQCRKRRNCTIMLYNTICFYLCNHLYRWTMQKRWNCTIMLYNTMFLLVQFIFTGEQCRKGGIALLLIFLLFHNVYLLLFLFNTSCFKINLPVPSLVNP